jgi:dynein heavy chain 2
VSSLTGKSLIFFKTNAESITPENMKTNILMSSLVDSPVDTLYHLIHNVYSPVLQLHQSQNSRGQDAYDAKLTNNLADLESNLKIAIRRSETGNSSSKRSALSPLDEFQYWADMSERGKDKDAKERAAFFFSEFEPLIKFYKKIENIHVLEIMEIIEATQDSYDYIWQQVDYEPTYSQDRMINLLEITGFTNYYKL